MNDTQEDQEQKRKPGRPRRLRNFIIYRSGRKLKAWNTDLQINMIPNEREITSAMKIYKGLGEDHVYWGRKLTREGHYNIAKEFPFRKPDEERDDIAIGILEENQKKSKQVNQFLEACSDLFEGHVPHGILILRGAFWMRVLARIFSEEAGLVGISKNRMATPAGKVFAVVNVLPNQPNGYNYSLEAWRNVIHMVQPPCFCVKIDEDENNYDGTPDERLTAKDFAEAVLHSLWATKGISSCDADNHGTTPPVSADDVEWVNTPEVESAYDVKPIEGPYVEAPTSERDPEATRECLNHIVDANETIEPTASPGYPIPTTTTIEPYRIYVNEAEKQLPAPIIPEATPSNVTRTWGAIKQTLISLKGLTTSKELQAPAPLSRVLETVISHEATARLTAECRAIADKKARNEFKADNMHVFYPSCVFAGRAGGSKKENVTGYTGVAVLDFDGLKTQADAEDMRDNVFMEFPEVLFCAVSASGLGVYALVMLDFDGTEGGYKAALSAAMEQFESHGFMPDAGCSDPTRARYMSSDPDALSRPDTYTPKAFAGGTEGAYILPASMLRGTWTNSGRKKKGAGKLYLEEALRRIETAPEGMKDTTLTSVMGSVARLIRNYSMDSTKVYDQVRKVASACSYDTRKTEDKIRRLGVKSEGVGL